MSEMITSGVVAESFFSQNFDDAIVDGKVFIKLFTETIIEGFKLMISPRYIS
jgi:hypothetical protein